MKKFLLSLVLVLASTIAWAQNPTCPTRPYGDDSNACASTAFVQDAVASANITVGVTQVLSGTNYGVLFNNAGILGNTAAGTAGYALIGNGAAAPTFQGFTQLGTGASTRTWLSKLQDYAYTPEDFGALGNGINYQTDATISSGTASLSVSSGTFTSADIGKVIVIPGAGAAGGTLATTISAVGSTTSITLGTNASTSLAAVSTTINYGTDDTTALQQWANQVSATGGKAILSKSKNYIITSEITFKEQADDGGSLFPVTLPSSIWFDLNKRIIHLDFNGGRIVAGATMTNMVQLVYNSSFSGSYGEFHCIVENGLFNGSSLASRGIYMNAEGQCRVAHNSIYGTTSSGIKATSYGMNVYSHNIIRAPTCFDLTDGGADSLFIHNDLYPTTRGFYLTAATGGQTRIFSNAGTNELASTSPGTTVRFIEIDTSASSSVLRNINVIDNGVAGFDAFIYARGNAGAFNNKYFVVRGNNVLDYGTKATLAFMDTTETDGWIVEGNSFNPTSVTSTSKAILMTNDARSAVINNNIYYTSNTGIQVAFGNRGQITGNRLHNVGNATNTKAIRITNNSTRIIVSNNIIDQDSSSYAQNGIVEEDTSDYTQGTGNLTLNVATPVTLVGSNSHVAADMTGTGNVVLNTSPTFNTSVKVSGLSSGTATIVPQSAAGTPTLTLPTTSGTFATTASSPLSLSATTGAMSCPTCATTAGANIPTIAQGDLLYGSAANTLSALTKSTGASNFLKNSGTSNNPAWAQPAASDLSDGTTGSGSVVLATAPTMTNPVVGTQTARDNSTKAASTAYVDTATREKLSAARTYYVATTGSDSNTGLTTTSSTVTFTNGSANITWTSHGLSVGDVVLFTNSGGGLPTNFTASYPYYVKTAPDANTITVSVTNGGSAITAGSAGTGTQTGTKISPFLTIQKGITVTAGLDLNAYAVTVRVAGGTYTSGVTVDGPFTGIEGGGSVSLTGDTTTPSNVVISTTSANAIVAQNGTIVNVGGFKITTTTSGSALASIVNSKIVITGAMEFGAAATYHINAATGGKVTNFGVNYTISGGAAAHWITDSQGSISIQLATITLTGTPAFSGSFVNASGSSQQLINANTFSGSATGTRYVVALNSVVDTGAGGATYLPGNAAGSLASGGRYDSPGTPSVSSCGTSPGSPSGTDFSGKVVQGTSATGCTITFTTASTMNACTVSTSNATVQASLVISSLGSTLVVGHSSASSATLYWQCSN